MCNQPTSNLAESTPQAVDVLEDNLKNLDATLLAILLFDRTTRKNILWATSDYSALGEGYEPESPILPEQVTSSHATLIQPRVSKAQHAQIGRTRDKAEVFTPSWICNKQNNLLDNEWFGQPNIFNTEQGDQWIVNTEKIPFAAHGHTWKHYVDEKRLEITCGEAPYLVSRYDTVTGEAIPLNARIGLLDRKMRVVNENTTSPDDWYKWTLRAFQSVYGYEYQGDNLLLARENLLASFWDYYIERFHFSPDLTKLKEIARVISWNIWQMDGLKCVVPGSCVPEEIYQLSIFDFMGDSPSSGEAACPGCLRGNIHAHTGIYCKIHDWRDKSTHTFVSLMKGGF